MYFRLEHNNINVLNLEASLAFYKKALGMVEFSRICPEGGAFKLVFLGAPDDNKRLLELTWLSDRSEPYDLGDNESHLAFRVDDIKASHSLHEEMGCICYENTAMGIYFICDPDGYWVEILPESM